MKELKTTPILDDHAKVGSFFLKEFIYIALILGSLWVVMIILDSWFKIRGIYVFFVPLMFLSLTALVRYFLVKKITSPWYMHDFIARRFYWPRSIRGGSPDFKRKKR